MKQKYLLITNLKFDGETDKLYYKLKLEADWRYSFWTLEALHIHAEKLGLEEYSYLTIFVK